MYVQIYTFIVKCYTHIWMSGATHLNYRPWRVIPCNSNIIASVSVRHWMACFCAKSKNLLSTLL